MPEISNNIPDENKKTVENLDNSSESFTDSLEKIEENLKIDNDSIKVSDDIRTMYFKINSLSRSNIDNTKLETDYLKILEKYNELGKRSFDSQKEYTEATKDLLSDLGNLKTNSGEKLSEKSIDGGLFEAGVSLKEGVVKAGEKIYEELKGYFDMIGMAGDFPAIIEKIMSSISIDTFKDIYNELVEMGGDTIRDFNLILKNSTGLGKTVELSSFIPSVGIPILFDSVGPGKFLKILKLEKFIPETALKTMNDVYEKGKKVLEKGKEVVEKGEKLFEKTDKSIPDNIPSDNLKGDEVKSDTIRNNFSITDNETRKIAAIDVLKQKYGDKFEGFSSEQLNGIIEAHEIGKDLFKNYLEKNGLQSVDQLTDTQLKEIFNSAEGRIALRQKMKKLKESGVDMKYSDDLVRAGITGGVDVDNDFSRLMQGNFKPKIESSSLNNKGPTNKGQNDSIDDIFGESINHAKKLLDRTIEIDTIVLQIKKEIDGLFTGMEDISEKINNLGYIMNLKGIDDLTNQLNQQYIVILNKYEELALFRKEILDIDNQMQRYELITGAEDVVKKLIKMVDFDNGNYNVIANRYSIMRQQLQKKSDNFLDTVGRKKIELPIIEKDSGSLFSNLIKNAEFKPSSVTF